MPTHYIQVEAINLDHFVYDTHDISTIRGGSFILLDAVRSLADAFPTRLTPVTTAASVGLFACDAPTDIDQLCADIADWLDNFTAGHATFAVVAEPDVPTDFGLVLERLQARVRRRQWQQPTVAVPGAAVTAQECFIDGWRPGVVPYTVDPTVTDARISLATDIRRTRGRDIKHRLFSAILQDAQYNDDLTTRDLDQLAAAPDKGILSGKIAYIHVDGNRFGSIRRALCRTPEARRAFDAAVQGDCREPFLRNLLQEARLDPDFTTEDTKGNAALRLELLLWGGDEMTLIVPAWRGWQVLESFYAASASLAFGATPLTHRAVIIFCHHNAPILQIRRLADDLLNRTKKDLRESAPSSSGPLDHVHGDALHYLVLESFDMLRGSLSKFLDRYYAGADSYADLLLRAHELPDLRVHLSTLRRHISRGSLLAVIQALQQNDPGALLQARIKLIAGVDPDAAPAVSAALDALTANPSRWYLIADLWDYIPEWDQ